MLLQCTVVLSLKFKRTKTKVLPFITTLTSIVLLQTKAIFITKKSPFGKHCNKETNKKKKIITSNLYPRNNFSHYVLKRCRSQRRSLPQQSDELLQSSGINKHRLDHCHYAPSHPPAATQPAHSGKTLPRERGYTKGPKNGKKRRYTGSL